MRIRFQRSFVALTTATLAFVFAPLATAQGTPVVSDPHPGPERMTMNDKVREAKVVFVGTAEEIFFVEEDHDKRTLRKSDPNAGRTGFQSALLVVSVNKMLHSNEAMPKKIYFVYSSSPGDLIAEQRNNLLGRQMIFFANEAGPHSYELLQGQEKPRVVRRFALAKSRALHGPVLNPLPISYVKDVRIAVRDVYKKP